MDPLRSNSALLTDAFSPLRLRMRRANADVRSHMRMLSCFLALLAAIVSTSATAGGSYEPVQIKSISINSEVDYELVVTPVKAAAQAGHIDPYMGRCPTFTVLGTYSHRYGFPAFVTRDAHLAALAHLKQAHAGNRVVNLGWMGNGFAPASSTTPCIVRSRALHLHTEDGTTAVVSYHDAI